MSEFNKTNGGGGAQATALRLDGGSARFVSRGPPQPRYPCRRLGAPRTVRRSYFYCC